MALIWHSEGMSSGNETSAPRTARERVRLELTREITDVARRHLAESGSAALSLRAVARELADECGGLRTPALRKPKRS